MAVDKILDLQIFNDGLAEAQSAPNPLAEAKAEANDPVRHIEKMFHPERGIENVDLVKAATVAADPAGNLSKASSGPGKIRFEKTLIDGVEFSLGYNHWANAYRRVLADAVSE